MAQDNVPKPSNRPDPADDNEEAPASIVSEFWFYLRENKKWFLIPLIGVFVLLALLIIFSSSAGPLSPLIYSLF